MMEARGYTCYLFMLCGYKGTEYWTKVIDMMNVTKSRNGDVHWYRSKFQIAAEKITFSQKCFHTNVFNYRVDLLLINVYLRIINKNKNLVYK